MTQPTSRERGRERTREHILSAARELILESGLEHLSLRKVAERAHFSPASIYEYFDSKEALIQTLAGRAIAQLEARMARVPKSLSAPRRLARFASCYISFARECPEDFLLAFHRLPSKRTSPSQSAERSPYARLLAVAREGLADGSFAPVDAETIAYGGWAIAHGLASLQVTHLKDYGADFDAADERIIAAWIDGLRNRKKEGP